MGVNKLVETLADCHQLFSDYVGEDTPPAQTDPEYARRTRWFNAGREDQSGEWFFSFLLKTAVMTITANSTTPVAFPNDFQNIQSLKSFITVNGKINYTDPYEPNGNTLLLSRNFTTGLYQTTFSPTPVVNDTANVQYYGLPSPMVSSGDLVLVDGGLTVTFALMQYHFKNGNWTDYQAIKDEYDKELQENVRMDAINPAGAQTNQTGFEVAQHVKDQRQFYQGNARKNAG